MKTTDKSLQYLCTTYSAHPVGRDEAYLMACRLLGKLMNEGHRVYSPIAHCHTAERIENLPTTHEYWLEIDFAWIDKCDGVTVAQTAGWDKSKGIGLEIEYAIKTGKPVRYLHPETLQFKKAPHDITY